MQPIGDFDETRRIGETEAHQGADHPGQRVNDCSSASSSGREDGVCFGSLRN
jgi:hypothetical protein